jgi:hypothetical protein
MRTVLIILALSVVSGCTTVVTPPAVVDDPVDVYVHDSGFHASILLPRERAGYTEFAFGEWGWFALNDDRWWRAPAIMLLPSQGTLGRRDVNSEPTPGAVASGSLMYRVRVERAAAGELAARLNAQFEAGIETRVRNDLMDMDFVQVDPDYWLFRQCNSTVASWLRELDCDVRGITVLSAFRVREEAEVVAP